MPQTFEVAPSGPTRPQRRRAAWLVRSATARPGPARSGLAHPALCRAVAGADSVEGHLSWMLTISLLLPFIQRNFPNHGLHTSRKLILAD